MLACTHCRAEYDARLRTDGFCLDCDNAGVPALLARVADLEAALRPFAEYAGSCWDQLPDSHPMERSGQMTLTLGHCRRAATVLAGGEPDDDMQGGPRCSSR